jgi:hypothetical protein
VTWKDYRALAAEAQRLRRSIRNGRASPADRVRLAGLVSMARQTKTELRQGEK